MKKDPYYRHTIVVRQASGKKEDSVYFQREKADYNKG